VKFVSSRDVRNNPSEFREAVEREGVVLTVGGKPFAIAVGVDEDDIEETLDVLRRVRALRGMARMQRRVEERGLSGMTAREVDEEIREARRSRRSG
jgi:antitoxin (DNA-binding transcriptional repressor) of toxin-antitoxin stability system